MSDAGTPQPTPVNESAVEQAVREVLAPLDRNIDWLNNLMPALWFFVLSPAAIFVLMWYFEFGFWPALGLGVGGGLIGTVIIAIWQESWMVNAALKRFQARFPEGSPERPVALRILSEMESPSKAEAKLQEAVARTSPTDRIVRRRREAPEGQVDAALHQLGGAPPAAPVPAPGSPSAAPPPPAPSAPPRGASGGAFDYIPLKPREERTEEEKPS